MLEFLVLGIVPGTSFVLTLKWVIGLATVLCGALLLAKVSHQVVIETSSIDLPLDTPTIST